MIYTKLEPSSQKSRFWHYIDFYVISGPVNYYVAIYQIWHIVMSVPINFDISSISSFNFIYSAQKTHLFVSIYRSTCILFAIYFEQWDTPNATSFNNDSIHIRATRKQPYQYSSLIKSANISHMQMDKLFCWAEYKQKISQVI